MGLANETGAQREEGVGEKMFQGLTFGALSILILGNAYGPNVKVLLGDSDTVQQARMSPSGDRIVFRDGAVGKGSLREVFKDGSSRSLFGDGKLVYSNPRFSPQGMHLLLDVLNPDTEHVEKIEVRRVSDGKRVLRLPAGSATWGPDGKRIAIVHPTTGLMVIDFPSGKVRAFVAIKAATAPDVMPHVTFSPDGRYLAVVDSPKAWEFRLRLVDPQRSKSVALLQPGADATIRPFWSRDGKMLGALTVAAEDGNNASTIVVWNVRKLRQLPKNVYTSTKRDPLHTPAFSPDGGRIALIHRSGKTGKTDLYSVKLTDRKPAKLTRNGRMDGGSIRWSSGRRIVVDGANRVFVVRHP